MAAHDMNEVPHLDFDGLIGMLYSFQTINQQTGIIIMPGRCYHLSRSKVKRKMGPKRNVSVLLGSYSL